MNERLISIVLLIACVPLSVIAVPILVVRVLLGPVGNCRMGVIAIDQLCNAVLLNGYAWETMSSHAWRERTTWWGASIVWITGLFQTNHCEDANKHEQPLVDFIIEHNMENVL